MSTCLAGLCTVWNHALGPGPHLLWSSCNCSFGALSLALSLSPSLLLLCFFLPCLSVFLPCLAHYGWSPPAQLGNSLYTHTHSHSVIHTAPLSGFQSCLSLGWCTISYKTALLILFGQEMETIGPSKNPPSCWCKQTVFHFFCGSWGTIFHQTPALQHQLLPLYTLPSATGP